MFLKYSKLMRNNNEIYYKRDSTGNFIGINETFDSGNTIQIFPNPFSNEIKVNGKITEPCEIIIYDLTSRKLLQNKFTGTSIINTSNLAKGSYIFEVRNKNTVLKKGKIIKN